MTTPQNPLASVFKELGRDVGRITEGVECLKDKIDNLPIEKVGQNEDFEFYKGFQGIIAKRKNEEKGYEIVWRAKVKLAMASAGNSIAVPEHLRKLKGWTLIQRGKMWQATGYETFGERIDLGEVREQEILIYLVTLQREPVEITLG